MPNQVIEIKEPGVWCLFKPSQTVDITVFGESSFSEEEVSLLLQALSKISHRSLSLVMIEADSLLVLAIAITNYYQKEMGIVFQVRDEKAGVTIYHEGSPVYPVPSEDHLQKTSPEILTSKTILIATKNSHKTKEFRAFFEPMGYQVEDLSAYPDLPEIEETGMTFAENARLKAETIATLTGNVTLADDSGIQVAILGGLPGIWSARFSGPDATDERNCQKLLHELAMVFDKERRAASFHCTLVVAYPGKDSLVVEADWKGYIATEPRGENGFGYDPIFLVGESDKTAAQLSLSEKNRQSHRALALAKLEKEFPLWQAQHNY